MLFLKESQVEFVQKNFKIPGKLKMHAAIPRSHLWIVPNGGHGPIWGDMSHHFVETASAFLRGEWEFDPGARKIYNVF